MQRNEWSGVKPLQAKILVANVRMPRLLNPFNKTNVATACPEWLQSSLSDHVRSCRKRLLSLNILQARTFVSIVQYRQRIQSSASAN